MQATDLRPRGCRPGRRGTLPGSAPTRPTATPAPEPPAASAIPPLTEEGVLNAPRAPQQTDGADLFADGKPVDRTLKLRRPVASDAHDRLAHAADYRPETLPRALPPQRPRRRRGSPSWPVAVLGVCCAGWVRLRAGQPGRDPSDAPAAPRSQLARAPPLGPTGNRARILNFRRADPPHRPRRSPHRDRTRYPVQPRISAPGLWMAAMLPQSTSSGTRFRATASSGRWTRAGSPWASPRSSRAAPCSHRRARGP